MQPHDERNQSESRKTFTPRWRLAAMYTTEAVRLNPRHDVRLRRHTWYSTAVGQGMTQLASEANDQEQDARFPLVDELDSFHAILV